MAENRISGKYIALSVMWIVVGAVAMVAILANIKDAGEIAIVSIGMCFLLTLFSINW